MRENEKEEKVKHEMDEIETMNIELKHSVAKLLSKNKRLHKEIKNLKKIYKDQFDSIKKTHALSKEYCDSLIAQLNSKSMENANLKGQIQEKAFVTTTLQSKLRRLKGKHVLDNATTKTNATTIAPGMFKLDIEHLSHRLKNNRDAHEDYLKKTIENTNTIRGLVERARKQNPSEPRLDSACKFTNHVQELLVYVCQTCPCFKELSEKLVVVTHMNKVKKVRFSEPRTSSGNVKQVESSKTTDSNTHVLLSTGLKCSTSTCRSQPTRNKRNDRISQTLSETQKPKIKVYSMRPKQVKSVGCPDCSLVSGLRMLKTYDREPLSAHELCKSKKSSHQPKAKDTNQEKLYLLHMDLCGPMRVESINRKNYILVIIDDYSRFTWVKFPRSKDEALDAIIKYIKNIQDHLNATVCNVRIDNGTKFVNQTVTPPKWVAAE
ncbi:integrase, catalytic region, zinc finger, CCHC-type containing protein [Tanacetum coccineum]